MPMDAADAQDQLAAAATPADVDKVARRLLQNDGLPLCLSTNRWQPLTLTNGKHSLVCWCAPIATAFGDAGGLCHLARTTPFGAQVVADSLDAILPSRLLVRHLQSASAPHTPFQDVKTIAPYRSDKPPTLRIETPEAAIAASGMADAMFAALGVDPAAGDALTIGYKKSIVTGPNLDGSHVAIYGGWGGPSDMPWRVWQPYSTIHAASYSDYSHGVTLVSRKCQLDGEDADLRMDIFGSRDPAVYGLVSDMGRFDPIFPNAGSGSRGQFSATGIPAGGTPPVVAGAGKAGAKGGAAGGRLTGLPTWARWGLAAGVVAGVAKVAGAW